MGKGKKGSDTFALSVSQASEIAMAMQRSGEWTKEMVHRLAHEPGMMNRVREMLAPKEDGMDESLDFPDVFETRSKVSLFLNRLICSCFLISVMAVALALVLIVGPVLTFDEHPIFRWMIVGCSLVALVSLGLRRMFVNANRRLELLNSGMGFDDSVADTVWDTVLSFCIQFASILISVQRALLGICTRLNDCVEKVHKTVAAINGATLT